MDRLRTTLNVTGDAVVTGMVSYLTSADEIVPDLEGTTGVPDVPKEAEEQEA
jgi:Na+/H+-dicarboxylate symporter